MVSIIKIVNRNDIILLYFNSRQYNGYSIIILKKKTDDNRLHICTKTFLKLKMINIYKMSILTVATVLLV